MEKRTALPRPPPHSSTVSSWTMSVGCPVGPIRMMGSFGSRAAHRRELPPISRTMVPRRPFSGSTQAPVSARPSMARRTRAWMAGMPDSLATEVDDRGEGLEVLQAVELAGLEFPRRHGRVHHDLDDVVGEAVHLVDAGDELVVEPLEEGAELFVARRLRRRVERPREEARPRAGSRPWRWPWPGPRSRRSAGGCPRRTRRCGCRAGSW